MKYDVLCSVCLQAQRVLISFEGIRGQQCFSFVTMPLKAFSLLSSSSMQVTEDMPTNLTFMILVRLSFSSIMSSYLIVLND
jgi:hypothetical protein